MIKNILFDLDGVLVDAREWHYAALNKALHDVVGFGISKEDHLQRFDGLPTRIKLQILDKIDPDDYEKIFTLKQHHTLVMIRDYCKPDKKKIDMMHGLNNYRKACIINSIYKTAYEMLVCSGLNYYMEYVQGNECTAFNKPSPSPYLFAMSKMGIIPQETLIVEDSDTGIESATKSGANVLKLRAFEDLDLDMITKAIRKHEGDSK